MCPCGLLWRLLLAGRGGGDQLHGALLDTRQQRAPAGLRYDDDDGPVYLRARIVVSVIIIITI